MKRCLLPHRRFLGSWSHLWERLPWPVVQPCSCRQHPHPGEEANRLGSDKPSCRVCSSFSLPDYTFLRVLPFIKETWTPDLTHLTFFRFTNSFSAAVRLLISSSYLELEKIKSNWVRGEDDTEKAAWNFNFPEWIYANGTFLPVSFKGEFCGHYIIYSITLPIYLHGPYVFQSLCLGKNCGFIFMDMFYWDHALIWTWSYN